MSNGLAMASATLEPDNSESCLRVASLSLAEASIIGGLIQRIGGCDEGIALRGLDGAILAVLAQPAVFALLHRIAAIASSAEHYEFVQRQAVEIKQGSARDRYLEISDVIGR